MFYSVLKSISISIFLIAFLSLFNVSHASKITDTESRFSNRVTPEHAAKSLFKWNQSGIVYVVDYQDRRGYKISVYIDYVYEGADRFPVHKTSRMSLTSDEQQAFASLFEIYDESKIPGGEITVGGMSDSQAATSSSSNQTNSVARLGKVKYYFPPRSHPSGKPFDAYQFLIDNQMRTMLYEQQKFNPSVFFIDGMNFIRSIFDLSDLKLKDVGLGYELVFPNGSSIVVYPDPTLQRLVSLEGSALDEDGNLIPEPGAERFEEGQGFSSEESYMRMYNYLLDYFDFNPVDPVQQCNAYSTRLVILNGKIHYVIDRCLY